MNATLRAAWVIARRDFTALITSKAFIFFLIGPIAMFGIALAAGALGSQVALETAQPTIAVAMNPDDAKALVRTRDRLEKMLGRPGLPRLEQVAQDMDPLAMLGGKGDGKVYAATLSGSRERPLLTGSEQMIATWRNKLSIIINNSQQDTDINSIYLDSKPVSLPRISAPPDRAMTAQIGQMGLFLLTMLLAGMVLSNLVEEKTNKIIEILAASIPIDAIFLGKLFAMLAMAFVGIAVWAGTGALAGLALGAALPALPPPAVGWPIFLLLCVVYFSTAYLLLGSLFLGIGAMAATVREVQTLSMPVTMGQLLIFFFASYTLPRLGQPIEIVATLIPFSSPFAMLARAAQLPALWPHVLALLWQGIWTWAIIRLGTGLFRRNVLKTGSGKKRRWKVRAAPKRI